MRFKTLCIIRIALLLSIIGCDVFIPDNTGDPKNSDSSFNGNSVAYTDAVRYGEPHSGQYYLGPVDFAESTRHNACAPDGGYRDSLQTSTGLGGEFLAGISTNFASSGGMCDACILIETAAGRSIVARIITWGTTNDPGDIDVSPSVYDYLYQGEYPRTMSWAFASCPNMGPLHYEFPTDSDPWRTAFWVRNPKMPITDVAVKSENHLDFFSLRRETDGTFNDDGGFGQGEFTLRITGIDGQVIDDTFPSFESGELIVSTKQFK